MMVPDTDYNKALQQSVLGFIKNVFQSIQQS